MDFGEFVEQQLPRLRAYVSRLPGAQYGEIDDLLQEALLRAYQQRDRFASDEHAVNWICQVVRNLLVDRGRRWLRAPVLPYAEIDDTGVEPAVDPADVVVDAEQARLAVRAVGRLTTAQRELLWEHEVEGVSYADIARRTATPLATVRSVAHRARQAAAREFVRAGGAVAVIPALLARPWRRIAHRLQDATPAAQVLSLGISVLTVAAVTASPAAASTAPVTANRAAITAPTPTIPPPSRRAAVAAVAIRPAVAVPPTPTPSPRPPLAGQVPTGEFSGTYSSDCTFTPQPSNKILYDYTCDFAAVSDSCQVQARGASEVTACTVELHSAHTEGFAAGAQWTGDTVPLRHCERANNGHASSGSGHGTVRITFAPGTEPVEVPVLVEMSETGVSITSDDVKLLHLDASFPFTCVLPHQAGQVGFKGTMG